MTTFILIKGIFCKITKKKAYYFILLFPKTILMFIQIRIVFPIYIDIKQICTYRRFFVDFQIWTNV